MREQQDRQVDAQIAMERSLVERQINAARNWVAQSSTFSGARSTAPTTTTAFAGFNFGARGVRTTTAGSTPRLPGFE